MQGSAFIIFNLDANTALNISAQDEQETRPETDDDPNQQIGVDDRQNGDDEGNELGDPLLPQSAEDLRTGQFEARDDQDRSERRKRNAIQKLGQKSHTAQQQHTMSDRRKPGRGARLRVHRASNNDRGHRKPANHARDGVADALGDQLPVWGRVTLLRVQPIGRVEIQQRLK